VRNLVSNIKEGTQTEGVRELVAEKNIWTGDRRSDGRLEETAQRGNCTTRSFILYSSPNIIKMIKSRRIRWEGHVARMGEGRREMHIRYWWESQKGPQGRPRRRRVDNIKIDSRLTGWYGLDRSGSG
jgi:hypothetical protein